MNPDLMCRLFTHPEYGTAPGFTKVATVLAMQADDWGALSNLDAAAIAAKTGLAKRRVREILAEMQASGFVEGCGVLYRLPLFANSGCEALENAKGATMGASPNEIGDEYSFNSKSKAKPVYSDDSIQGDTTNTVSTAITDTPVNTDTSSNTYTTSNTVLNSIIPEFPGVRVAGKPCTRKNKFEEIDKTLAEQLLADVREIIPGFRQPNLDNWAAEMNRIRRIDGRTIDQIRTILSSARADNFWRRNILSPDKLRKHWYRLEMLKPSSRSTDWVEGVMKMNARGANDDDEEFVPVRWGRAVVDEEERTAA